MLFITIVDLGLILISMDHELKQFLTWGSDARHLGDIWKLHSPSLPGWNVFSLNSVDMDQTWRWNMTFISELACSIPRLPCLCRMGKAVLLTVDAVNSVTSNWVNSFHFAIWAFVGKCFLIDLVPCSGGCWRTWWQMIHMMPALPVCSILQQK